VLMLSCLGGEWSIGSSVILKSPKRKSGSVMFSSEIQFWSFFQKCLFSFLLFGAYTLIRVVSVPFHLRLSAVALPLINSVHFILKGSIASQFIMKATPAEL
jgi:hypothetical protein